MAVSSALIGAAATKPAEFVIFHIGQWTADVKRSSREARMATVRDNPHGAFSFRVALGGEDEGAFGTVVGGFAEVSGLATRSATPSIAIATTGSIRCARCLTATRSMMSRLSAA